MTLDQIESMFFKDGEVVAIDGSKLQEIIRRMKHAERQVCLLNDRIDTMKMFLDSKPKYLDVTI